MGATKGLKTSKTPGAIEEDTNWRPAPSTKRSSEVTSEPLAGGRAAFRGSLAWYRVAEQLSPTLRAYFSLPPTIGSSSPASGLLSVAPIRHYMQTRRIVTTYKSRNRRKRDQDDEQNHPLTSPLSEIDKEETTLSEMNRRIGKRSRLLSASSVPGLSFIADASIDSAPTRNSKRHRVGGDASATSGPLSTVFNAEVHANSFQTPLTSALPPGKHASSGYLHHHPASSFSPVPLTKPVFNPVAKENVANSKHQTYLASPFNSQPNSRNASPTKPQPKPKPTKRHRTKSRTLSTHLAENRDIAAPTTDNAPSPDRKKMKTLHHGRNPSLPSFTVDDSPEWLNYAGAKPRKPVRGGRRGVPGSSRSISSVSSSGSRPRPQLLPIHHPSFSLEAPLAFSTPPANRRLGRSPQDSVNWSWSNISLAQRISDTDIEGDDEDVEMADAENLTPDSASRVPRPTKLRRQTVHVSRDSLFSSMEISDSRSVSTITGISARSSGGNATVDRNMRNVLPDSTALTSTMSLTGILDPTDTNRLSTLGQAFEPIHDNAGGFSRTTDDGSVSSSLTKGQPKDGRTCKRSTVTYLEDLEALGTKVSEMNLQGLVRLVAVVLHPNPDAVAASLNRSRSMPSPAENDQARQEERLVAGSSKNVAGRVSRKRSDTIRASDYNVDRLPQPKEIWLKPAPVPKRKAPARKRSGTVTQKDYRTGVRVCRDGRVTKIDDGLPLSPQKDEESDDELLLK